jgi:hypothetical protein
MILCSILLIPGLGTVRAEDEKNRLASYSSAIYAEEIQDEPDKSCLTV